jgi:arsenate reductase (glutaredoxin)
MEIWHNPRCSKSRAATAFLDEAGVDYTVRRYLEDPPSADEISGLLERLGLEPWDITRTGDQPAKDLGVATWPKTAGERDRWIALLAEHPALIQRPIVVGDDGRAVVARTDQSLQSLL